MKNTSKSHPFLPLLLMVSIAMTTALISCHKDPGSTIFQGYVTAYGTGEPLEGARVYVLCETAGYFGASKTELIDSLVTDEKGYFHIEYPNKGLCGGIFLTAYKEGYFYNTAIYTHTGLNDLEVVMDPKAWVKIRCIADQGQSTLDFQIDNYSESTNIYQSKDTVFNYLRGNSPLYGNRDERISWTTYPNNKYYQDTVFLKGLDTTVYTIHY